MREPVFRLAVVVVCLVAWSAPASGAGAAALEQAQEGVDLPVPPVCGPQAPVCETKVPKKLYAQFDVGTPRWDPDDKHCSVHGRIFGPRVQAYQHDARFKRASGIIFDSPSGAHHDRCTFSNARQAWVLEEFYFGMEGCASGQRCVWGERFVCQFGCKQEHVSLPPGRKRGCPHFDYQHRFPGADFYAWRCCGEDEGCLASGS